MLMKRVEPTVAAIRLPTELMEFFTLPRMTSMQPALLKIPAKAKAQKTRSTVPIIPIRPPRFSSVLMTLSVFTPPATAGIMETLKPLTKALRATLRV